MSRKLSNLDDLSLVLEKYLGAPALIPHDMEKRKAYIKTLHPDLVRYIQEKRGIGF